MVRGQLAGAAQAVLRGDAFSQCTACSPAVVAALRSGGWPFLLKALRVRASRILPLPSGLRCPCSGCSVHDASRPLVGI